MMENSKPKISSKQLFALLMCSRIVVTLTFSVNNENHTVSNSDWISAILMIPALLLLAIPVFLLIKRDNTRTVIDCAGLVSPFAGKVTGVLYALFFASISVISVTRFNFFITSAIHPEQGMFFYPLIIFASVAFAVIKGIEAISRTGTVFAVIGCGVIVTIFALLVKRFDITNVFSPFYNGTVTVLSTLRILVSNSVEVTALAVIFPDVKRGAKKAFCSYAVFSGVGVAVIMLLIILTLGAYGTVQEFPFYTTAGVAQMGNLKRLDALQTALWLVGAFIKSSLFIYLSTKSLEKIIPAKYKNAVVLFECLCTAAVSALFSFNVDTVEKLIAPDFLTVGIILFGFFIPALIYVLSHKRYQKGGII